VKIVVAGGTGFLGRPLTGSLAADRHDVVVLTRRASATSEPARRGGRSSVRAVTWSPGATGAWRGEIDGADAVVNLAGESIAGGRWSRARKHRILDSRVRATRSLAAAIAEAARPPGVFVSGSAVGYYGPHGNEIVTEETAAGTDFLAGVCAQWEAEANRASGAHTRVVCVRTGLVLERDGGALPPMLLPFKVGVGGRAGSGHQYWPWIHRDDWVSLIQWVLQTPSVIGPLNATAPTPVTNLAFARALGRALHRPSLFPAPRFVLRAVLGEMADALVLSGQRAVPAKAAALGFTFRYEQLDEALNSLLRRS
jgi:uncharacterized protein (TIGR01777 family)